MGRSGITFIQVADACEAILKESKGKQKPTIDLLRERIGAGSRTTLNKYKKQWEEMSGGEAETLITKPEKVTESILSLVSQLSEKLSDEAKQINVKKSKQHAAEIEERDGLLAEAERRNEGLSEKLDGLQTNHEKLQSAYDDIDNNLKSEIEARTKAEETVIQKDERIDLLEKQVKSLEDKHTQARKALEHFRDAVKDQREKDQQQWEQLQGDYQHQIKGLQDDLSSKNTSITELSEANGQLAEQNSGINKQLIEKEKTLSSIQGLLEKATLKVEELEPKLQEKVDQVISQQERITDLTAENTRLSQAETDKARLLQKISDQDRRHQDQVAHYQSMLDGSKQDLDGLSSKLEIRDVEIEKLQKEIQRLEKAKSS